LISHLQEYSLQKAQREILTSLTLPYLKYIVEKSIMPEVVYSVMDNNVLTQDLLKECEQRVLKEIFKIFVKSATSSKIKHLFVTRAQGIYKGEDLSICL